MKKEVEADLSAVKKSKEERNHSNKPSDDRSALVIENEQPTVVEPIKRLSFSDADGETSAGLPRNSSLNVYLRIRPFVSILLLSFFGELAQLIFTPLIYTA